MRPELDDKEWRTPITHREGYRESRDKNLLYAAARQAKVSEGYVLAKELGVRGSSRPIPPGECAITSLCRGRRKIFGATSGKRAHIFAYDPDPASEVVIDVLAVDEHTHMTNSLAWVPKNGIFAGTSAPEREDYQGGEILKVRRPYLGDVIQEWGSVKCQVESLGVPVEGEGIACLIADQELKRLYGLSDVSGSLFTVDLPDEKVTIRGQVDDLPRFSPHLLLGPDRCVYACGTAGHLVRYDPSREEFEDTGLFLPSMRGRAQYSEVGAWVMDENTGQIYAGDVADGLLSAIDPRRGEVRILGKPVAQPHIRSLTVAPDGRVYGTAGQRGAISHLFCYTPATRELRDLGVMTAGTERRWYGYEFDCAVAGEDGRLYFGETDRISHLFVYFPPMQPVTGTTASHLHRPKRIGPTGSEL